MQLEGRKVEGDKLLYLFLNYAKIYCSDFAFLGTVTKH